MELIVQHITLFAGIVSPAPSYITCDHRPLASGFSHFLMPHLLIFTRMFTASVGYEALHDDGAKAVRRGGEGKSCV